MFAGFFLEGMLCILLWGLCVYKEYRSIWLGLEAVWRIPRSKRTVFRHNVFHSIGPGWRMTQGGWASVRYQTTAWIGGLLFRLV